MTQPPPALLARCFAEGLGTFILIFFGCGAVHAAVLTGAQSGVWQVAIVWGGAVMVAVYVVGGISGAHINPAVTVALACFQRFSWAAVLPYVLSQIVGAFLAAATLYVLFGSFLVAKEHELQLVRGKPGSEITAMCYGEYYPSPGRLEAAVRAAAGVPPKALSETQLAELVRRHQTLVSTETAFLAEVVGTLLLALVVFALTDPRNAAAPLARLAPVFIGLTVAMLISVIGPLTQSCLNPARDFGPRLVTWLGGWGEIAVPGPRGHEFVTVYMLAPIAGAVLGGALYVGLVRRWLPEPEEKPA